LNDTKQAMFHALKLREVEALERTAKANEALISLAQEQQAETANAPDPPCCPHCGMVNPTIHSEGGDGPMLQFALVAKCENCKNTFAGLPHGFTFFRTTAEAAAALNEGREDGNSNST
jgi:hypothetical protein